MVRDSLPKITHYANGATTPSPSATDFRPGALLGCVSGGLGLSTFLKSRGHQYVVTSDKDGVGCALDRHLPTSDIVISQPFWPAYITAARMAASPKLKLAITAGIGSDHVDLAAAMARGVDVVEVTGCNSISVSGCATVCVCLHMFHLGLCVCANGARAARSSRSEVSRKLLARLTCNVLLVSPILLYICVHCAAAGCCRWQSTR